HLDLLGFGPITTTLDQGALHAIAARPGAGDRGVVGEGYLELLAVLGAVPRDLTRRQVVVAVGLVAHGSEATAPHDAISHHQHPSLHVSPRICAGYAKAMPANAFTYANGRALRYCVRARNHLLACRPQRP